MEQRAAQEALEQARRKGAMLQRVAAAQSLPRAIFAKVLGKSPFPPELAELLRLAAETRGGYWADQVLTQSEVDLGRLFTSLTEAELERVQRTLLPRLQPSVAVAWQILARRPYQRGATRRAFRSPKDRGTLARRRGEWLLRLAHLLGDHDGDIAWVATWAPHLAQYGQAAELGWLLAGALDRGGADGDAVFDVLQASMRGGHEVAAMGRHVTQALLSCARPEAWQAVERLLLAAQREEGLRQVVLEAVDEAHPDAFRRMLRLILDEDLVRFAAVVRAVDVWFGFEWGTGNERRIHAVLETVLALFADPVARDAAVADGDAERAYLALWTLAFEDVDRAVPAAVRMLADASPERRYVAVHLLVQTGWMPTRAALLPMLDDPELRVAGRALDAYRTDVAPWVKAADAFPALERLAERLPPKPRDVTPLVWPWSGGEPERADVAQAMVANRGGVSIARLLPHVRALGPDLRAWFVRDLVGLAQSWVATAKANTARLDAAGRAFLIEMLGDASSGVRDAAFRAMADVPVQADETERLIELLGRKAGDLRTHCLSRLGRLPAAARLEVASRLLGDADAARRLAGLELLRGASERGELGSDGEARARAFAQEHRPTAAERVHLDVILGDDTAPASPDDAFGLVDPAALPRWPAPRALPDVPGREAAARRCVESLAELVEKHRAVEVRVDGSEPVLLLDAGARLCGPVRTGRAVGVEAELPLRDVFHAWSAAADRDAVLGAFLAPFPSAPWQGPRAVAIGQAQWSGAHLLRILIEWSLHWHPPRDAGRYAVDEFERREAALSDSDVRDHVAAGDQSFYGQQEPAWRQRFHAASDVGRRVALLRRLAPAEFAAADRARFYALLRAHRLRCRGDGEIRLRLTEFLDALAAATLGGDPAAEFRDLLIGRFADRTRYHVLEAVSRRVAPPELQERPELVAAIDECRRRVVELACQRGDRESAATLPALALRWPGGLEVLQFALPALGKTPFARGSIYGSSANCSRQQTLSVLVARSAPRPEDTPEAFAAWARDAQVRERRLVELAAYAPQWVGHVARMLRWPGLASAVWWIQAHTKDDGWNAPDLREEWAARISEYTPLSAQDLTEGAVDVAWFHAAHSELGPERWQVLYAAAKYASSSGGHKRAQRFADAMTGAETAAEILERIDAKRHQDAVRALGLVPLPDGAEREPELLRRYRRLQEFRRESRQFGSQRQASEGRAVALGLENLARTAGFRDPLRLQWAMERAAVADLAVGPITLTRGDVEVRLALTDEGAPELTVTKKGRSLRAVPAALRKDTEIAALRDRQKELRRQAARVRAALEEAMCRGDRFTGAELEELFGNPMLAGSLERLVFVGEGIAGYVTASGKALVGPDGAVEPVRRDEELRIAHPHDLLARGDWSSWQRECLQRERLQPFKQVFRELYVVTADERVERVRSRRYAGHQVQPRQALALLGGRGWVARPEEGVSRAFHAEGLVAHLDFQEGFYTPADVEGLTLASVCFTRRGTIDVCDVADVPPRLFSEVMRDLDLVVSVAHRGGVDPEASASTVEMRAALLRETCTLLGLANVAVDGHHAVVRGTLGEYSLHLGSALVHRLGGPALCIVAVQAQHRGRLFLPFADDDPRTAEVMAKALLLARDGEIRDPNILDQLRGRVS